MLRVPLIYTYIVAASFIVSVGLYVAAPEIRFGDAIFLGVSAVTSTGLATVDYTAFPASAQVILFLGMLSGSAILLSVIPSVLCLRECLVAKRDLLRQASTDETNDEAMSRITQICTEASVAKLIVATSVIIWVAQVVVVTVVLWARFPLRWAAFLSVSVVNNVGLSPSKTDFLQYRNDALIIRLCAVMMPLGNTLFPVVFRSVLAVGYHFTHFQTERLRCSSSLAHWHNAAKRLLDQPRSYFPHLFSTKDTIVVLFLWCALTLVEFVMFIPEYNTSVFPTGADIVDQVWLALFQTISVRTSGFMVFDVTAFRVGHLAFWMLAMYVTAYPLVMTARFRLRKSEGRDIPAIGASIAGRDMTWLYLSAVIILFSEDRRINAEGGHPDPSSFLRTCFEVVSAFGNVGLSLSKETGVTSFCSEWNFVSRSVIVLLMIAGKVRCFPSVASKLDAAQCATSEGEIEMDVQDY